jgi:hypothetical protein
MAGAIVGALPVVASFIAAILLLLRMKPLWQASEERSPLGRGARTNMTWLI